MVQFSRFDASPGRLPPLPAEVGPLVSGDVAGCAALAAQRQEEPLARWQEIFRGAVEDPDQVVLVARNSDQVVGYGKAAWLDPVAAGGRGMSPGWYLTGVVVDPSQRRRGVAQKLTRARLQALAQRGATEVWCFAAAVNTASIRLHEHVGFVETSRDIAYPGITFTGGVGVLMRWTPT